MNTKRKWIIAFISLAGLILAGSSLVMRLQAYGEGKAQYQGLQEKCPWGPDETLQEGRRGVYGGSGQESGGLSWLSAQNPDYACWLLIPKTKISYPVVASADPGYYLNHVFGGEENPCGSIFSLDKPEWPWDNLVLYGHNMKDGSMFAGLKRYMEEGYCREHPDLWLNLYGAWLQFTVFSCVVTGEEDEAFYQGRFARNEEKEEFLEKAQKRSLYPVKVSPLTSSPILTLSTCLLKGKRIIVLAASLLDTDQ